jgi:peroxiredoxin Q/BCP
MDQNELHTGDAAPGFTLPDAAGTDVTLRSKQGSWVVLYFYPKDDTPGCTVEAIDFTAHARDFKDLNAQVIGISPDSCESHRKFILNHGLGILLLSDTDRSVLEGYGVWRLKKMYGKESYGVVRSTFLIDPAGMIRRIWRKVDVKGHAEEVLSAIGEQQSERAG